MKNSRAIEALAQLLYETSDSIGVPWSQRLPIIRGPWLLAAKGHLSRLWGRDQPSGPAGDKPAQDLSRNQREGAVFGAYQKHGKGARPLSLGTLMQETNLDPGVLVYILFSLIERGLLVEVPIFSGFGDQLNFSLLDKGRVRLAEHNY